MRDLVAAPSAVELVGALAEPQRLTVLSAVALGAGTVAAVRDATGLPARDVEAAVRRLRGIGLISFDGELITLHAELFKAAARESAAATGFVEFAGHPDADVLRAFLRRGELLDMPADQRRREIVLRYIADSEFESAFAMPNATSIPRSITGTPITRRYADTSSTSG
jgi:DNA-binding transcriptional ArsR family regulator